jgi:hypothetical protein
MVCSVLHSGLDMTTTHCELYVGRASAPRVETADAATFLVGSYAGKPSFGAGLELKSTIDLHTRLRPQRALFVLARAPTAFHADAGVGGAVIPIYTKCGDSDHAISRDDLVSLSRVPPSTLIHVYGGGFVNDWSGRPLRLAIEELIARHAHNNVGGRLSIFVSGQQVAACQDAEAWRPFFERADYLGARDAESLTVLRALTKNGSDGCPIELSGDDSLPALMAALQCHRGPEPTIAAHVSLADHSCVSPERRLGRMARALAVAAARFELGLTCDLLVSRAAGTDDEEAAQRLEMRYRSLAGEGAAPPLTFRVRDIDREAADGVLQLEALALISCSYHVALAGLLSGCPTALLVENDDYRQKAATLSKLFNGQLAVVRVHEEIGSAVTTLIGKAQVRPGMAHGYRLCSAQTNKIVALSHIYAELEGAEVRDQLKLVSRAFGDTAAQLGELRKRLILEERLAREQASSFLIPTVLVSPAKSQKYLSGSYWRKRRQSWLKSLRKRLDRMASS